MESNLAFTSRKTRKVFQEYVLQQSSTKWFACVVSMCVFGICIQKFIMLYHDLFLGVSLTVRRTRILRGIVGILFVTSVPFIYSTKYPDLSNLCSGIITISGVLILESIFRRNHSFVTVYTLLFILFIYKSFQEFFCISRK